MTRTDLPEPKRFWWHEARCKTLPMRFRNEVFFPSSGGNIYKTAKLYCEKCPVRDDCLNAAIREETGVGRRMIIGMRGGKTPSQRWAIYNKLRDQGLVNRRSNAEGIKRLARFENHSRTQRKESN